MCQRPAMTTPPKTSKRPKQLPKPHAALVDDLARRAGGEVALAYRLGVTQYAIRQWRVRGVPEDHWLRAAEVCGVTVDHIWRAAAGRDTIAP
jgi:hypothetical protein